MVGGSSRGNPGEAEAQNKSFPRPHTNPTRKVPKRPESTRKNQKYKKTYQTTLNRDAILPSTTRSNPTRKVPKIPESTRKNQNYKK